MTKTDRIVKRYERLYSLVSLLPEDYSIPLGRFLYRILPLEKLDIYEVKDERLKIDLNGCELDNPVILAACYHQEYMLRKAMYFGFGAVSFKSTLELREGHKGRVIVRYGDGFANCLGYKNPGMEGNIEIMEGMPGRAKINVSITGDTIHDYVEMAVGFGAIADMIEINISCPSTETGLDFSKNPGAARELFREVRKATGTTLAAKLSPDRELRERNFRYLIPCAIDEGIDVIDRGNTMGITEPGLAVGKGGYSGPGLYEGMVEDVKGIYREFGRDIKIIATGGIDSGEKALKAIMSGATAVSFITGFIKKGPLLPRQINENLLDVLDVFGFDSVGDLVGLGHRDAELCRELYKH